MTENRRRALAESYFELGEVEKAETLYWEWLSAAPCWGWGWIGWSDCHRFTRTERADLNRCELILREGLGIADVRDRADIAGRLADVCQERGRDEEAKEFRRQSELRAITVEVSRTVSSAGKVLRRKTQVSFGGAGLPPSEVSNVEGILRETPTPVTRQKVGRNEPCPCAAARNSKSVAAPDSRNAARRPSH